MLLERNDNKRIAEMPATKHHAIPKNTKMLQKENKTFVNNQFHTLGPQKRVLEPVIEDPKKNLLVTETNKIKSLNLKKILAFELSKSKGNFRPDFLQQHKLTADIRTRMVR